MTAVEQDVWACPHAVEVMPADAGRTEWLAARRAGIGGSDAATVAGLNPYSSRYELYLDKTGQLPEKPTTSAMEWGHRLEPVIARWFSDETGLEVRDAGLLAHVERGWQLVTPDRLVADGGILEMKCLDIDTPLLTTRGWSSMRDIQVGDEVFHPDGHPVRVEAVSDVKHGKPCYRVTTTDGKSVVADSEHVWAVQDVHQGAYGRGQWETVTTTDLLRRGLRTRRKKPQLRFRLPATSPVISKPVDLPIDPYVLGAWLGDGTTASAQLTCADIEIVEQVRATGLTVERTDSPYRWQIGRKGAYEAAKEEARRLCAGGLPQREAMRRVGLPQGTPLGISTVSHGRGVPLSDPSQYPNRIRSFHTDLREAGLLGNKHIPDAYLTAGTEQRLALLQGLLDTDGGVSARGQVYFCSTSERLADGVLYLARSLGWSPTSRRYERDHKPYWLVRFTPTQEDLPPFRLTRKADRVVERSTNWRHGRIADISPVPTRPVRCIRVAREDGLFLAGRDLLPTHNSTNDRQAKLWDDDQVPDAAELQCQHCLAVTGRSHAWVAVLVNGRDPMLRRVERDESLIETLTEMEREFWESYVLPRREPPIDDSETTASALAKRFPVDTVDELAVDDTVVGLLDEWERAKDDEKTAKGRARHAQSRIAALVGEAGAATVQGERVLTFAANGTFSTKQFTAEHPELAAELTITKPGLDMDALKSRFPDLHRRYCARVLRRTKNGNHNG